MKNRLNKITVKSFVTDVETKPAKKVVGGAVRTANIQECIMYSDFVSFCCVPTDAFLCG